MAFTTALACLDCGDLSGSGACPSCKTINIGLSLFTAAEYGDLDAIKAKLARRPGGGGVNAVDSSGYTMLHYAAQHDRKNVVEWILQEGGNVDGPEKCGCGATPLHRAAYKGNYDVCEMLINAGAALNKRDESFGDLRTALHKAYSMEHHHVVKLLLQRGADAEVRDANNFRYDHVAAEMNMLRSHDLKPKLKSGAAARSRKAAPVSSAYTCESCGQQRLCFGLAPCCGHLFCEQCIKRWRNENDDALCEKCVQAGK